MDLLSYNTVHKLTTVICIFNIFYIHWTQVFSLTKFAIIVWTRLFGCEDHSWVVGHSIFVMHDRGFIVLVQNLASEKSSKFCLIAAKKVFSVCSIWYKSLLLHLFYCVIVDLNKLIPIHTGMFVRETYKNYDKELVQLVLFLEIK